MSEYKIAIKIAGQLEKSYGAALKGAQAGLKGLGRLAGIGAAGLTAAGAAIAGVTTASTNVGREFEAAMSSVAATAGASAEDFAKLEAAAMEMGRTTSKTATESANALEYMALAGWSVDDSIKGLPSVLRLSEATGLDLARTSDLVTDSMSACGVSVDQLSDYLDVCAKANNKSNQTAEQLMEAYLGVGGTMKTLNVPITESATALGILANRGIKGSEAGTALNAIMTNLTTGTGQAGKMMDKLGLSAFDSEGNFIGLQETLQLLNGKLSGMTEEERNAALAAIGGKEHIDALNDLMAGLNTTLEDGSTEWEALQENLENSGGALEQMAKTKLDNLNGDIAIFQSALEDCGIKIYKNLSAPFREVAQYGTSAIYQLSDALESGGFEGLVEELGSVLADAVTRIASYGPQFVDAAVNLAMSFLSGIQNNSGEIASGAVDIAAALIGGLIRFVPAMVVTGAFLLAEFLAGAAQKLPELMQMGTQGVGEMVSGILMALPSMISSATSIMFTLLMGLSQMMPMLLQGGIQAVIMLVDGLAQAAPVLIPAAVMLIGQMLVGLTSRLPDLLASGLRLVVAVGQGIINSLPAILSCGAQIIVNLINAIVTGLPMLLSSGVQLILSLIQGIGSNLGNIISAAIQIVGALVAGLISAIPMLGTAAIELVTGLIDGIFETDWLAVGWDMVSGIADGFMEGFHGLVDSVKGLWDDFTGWLFGDGEEAGELSGEGMAAGIEASSYVASEAAGRAAHQASEYYSMDTETINGYGREAVEALAQGMQDGSGGFMESYNSLFSTEGKFDVQKMMESMQVDPVLMEQYGLDSGEQFTAGFDTALQGIDTESYLSQLGVEGFDMNQMLESVQLDTSLLGDYGQQGAEQYTDSFLAVLQGSAADIEAYTSQLGSQYSAGLTGSMALAKGVGLPGGDASAVAAAAVKQDTAEIQAAVSELQTVTEEGFSAIVTSTAKNMATILNGIRTSADAWVQAARDGLSGIETAVGAIDLYGSGVNMMQGFINGINSMRAAVDAAAAEIANSAATAVNSALQIHSPSRVLDQSGQFAGIGFAGGMQRTAGMIRQTAEDSLARPAEEGAGQTKLQQPGSGSRSSVIRDTLQGFRGGNDNGSSKKNQENQTATFVFSPTYQFQGTAPEKEDVVEANRMSMREFEKMMRAYQKNRGRAAFA